VDFVRAVVDRGAAVVLDPPAAVCDALAPVRALGRLQLVATVDRDAEAAIIARARGFLGSYGSSALVAALLGVPAVALYSSREQVADEDLQIAASFLGREPFGRLHVCEATRALGDAAELAARLLEDDAKALSLA
jgi:hypothetical protein